MTTSAYLLINTDNDAQDSILKQLKSMAGITQAYSVYGTYDIICRLNVESMSELKSRTKEIRNVEGMRGTISLIIH